MTEDLISDLQRKNEKLMRKIKELEGKVQNPQPTSDFEQKIIELTTQLEESQRELTNYKTRSAPSSSTDLIGDMQIQVEKLKSANKRLKAEADQEIQKLKQQLEPFINTELDIEKIKSEKAQIEKKQLQLNEKIVNFQNEKSQVDSLISSVQSEYNTLQKEFNSQQENITSLQTALGEVQTTLTEKEQQITRMENQIQAERKIFEKKIVEANKNQLQTVTELNKLKNLNSLRDQEIRKQNDSNDLQKQEIQDIQSKFLCMKTDLINLKERETSLQTTNDYLLKQLQEKDQNFELKKQQENASFQSIIDQKTSEISKLIEEIEQLKKKIDSLTEQNKIIPDNSKLLEEIDRLNKLVASLEKEKIDTNSLIIEIEDSRKQLIKDSIFFGPNSVKY